MFDEGVEMSTRPSLADFQNAQVETDVPGVHSVPAKKSKNSEELIQTSFRLPRSKWKKLQELSIDDRKSVQALLIEALEISFAKRGLKF